CAFRTR
ncbi:catalase/peroxidase HPI, partial [Vibrio parahaemolyticus 10296]